ncbi:glycosyl transferase [Leptolyngbya sp. 'hensonii']|uniref:glycosyltransferase family 4 protein n=1 Tax=Leptolyngbya sp. 'hensonii' TaxID=1922337 RepID=UPI00094FE918|nr:glycosyltransferase family 4 protein [Leptolyngbya sp. 'hensonii']OLP20480.1 glycosyl transferase [Leptolyngbya sp. 'hensonii']
MHEIRIAWLLTSAFYYWHPMLSCLSRLFPQTTAFAANWQGYGRGFEHSFAVEVVGQRKIIPVLKSETSYGSNFTYLPLGIVKHLLRFKPQVVFSNSFGMWTLLALLLKPIGRWRVVLAYEGSSPGVDYRNSPTRLAIRRAMVRSADACITNSHAGQAYLVEILHSPPEKVFVQPYEVPSAPALLASARAVQLDQVEGERPIFVFVGSLKPRKGLLLLLKACVLLKQQGYDRYTLWVVGDGPQRSELEAFCQQQGLTDRVHWIGQVEYEQVGAYFQQADVFVLPTLEDTWGVVVLEAMAIGKAVLCSQFAGASELIVSEENGFVFDPNQSQALAAAMGRFIADPDLSDRMGQRSAQMMTQFSPEAAAEFMGRVATFVLQSED